MNIGLVLSGGGMRGVAHLGVIKALGEYGIHPTHISGSSAGAIVGGLYAYGYSWEDILQFFESIQILDIKKYALGKPGFIDTEKFYPEFKNYIKNDNFNALEKSLAITATDILSGSLKVFTSGELIKPILASSAFPGVFAPVEIMNSYYIDGGTLNNFPIEHLNSECDIIIGSYANGHTNIKIKDLKHSYNVIERAFKLITVHKDYLKFKDCDIVIAPKELDSYGTFEKKNIKQIFKIGYEEALKVLDSNKGIIKKVASDSVY